MKHTGLFLISLLFLTTGFSFKAVGQATYLKGYIVVTVKDTLFGEVKVNPKRTVDNFMKVSWRKKEGNEVRMFPPKKIIGYMVDSSWFFSRTVDSDPVFVKRLSTGDSTSNVYELQVQYEAINEIKSESDYYIERENKDFVKIKNKKAIKLIEEAKKNNEKIEVKQLGLKDGKE